MNAEIIQFIPRPGRNDAPTDFPTIAFRSAAQDPQYAYRPGRNAQQAVVKVEELLFRGHPSLTPMLPQTSLINRRGEKPSVAKPLVEIRADFQHLRRWRRSVEQAQSYTFKAVITVIVTGFVGAVWLGIKATLGK